MTGLEACLERRCVSERAHLTSGWPLEVNQKGVAGNAGCDRLATPAVGICDTSNSSAPSIILVQTYFFTHACWWNFCDPVLLITLPTKK